MILRKTPSQFLRTLRQISPDQLPALPEKRLSARQYRRLEDAVYARIAEDENRTVFERYAAPTRADTTADLDTAQYEMRYEIKPIRGAWKKNLAAVLAACLCFAVICSAFLLRGNIASYLTTGQWSTDGAVTDHEDTQAIHIWSSDENLPETGVEPPYEDADGLTLEISKLVMSKGRLYLSLTLRSVQPMEGIAVQYYRAILTRWNPETKQHEELCNMVTSPNHKEDVLAGEIDFPLVGLGKTNTVSGDVVVYGNYTEMTGLFHLTLEKLTLVYDSPSDAPPIHPEDGLAAVPLTDGTVTASFVITPQSVLENAVDEPLPPRDTVTPPPELAYPPHDVSRQYSLSVNDTKVIDNSVTLDLQIKSQNGFPVGYGIYYKKCEIELWNHEKQVWEGKYGTDDSGVRFDHMLMAGDMHFSLTSHIVQEDAVAFAAMSYPLPGDGWYRITLRGLVLVRDAMEGEESSNGFICETIEEDGIYAVFHKESVKWSSP